ncbi:hypothetical protein [Antarctobacter sp.]|uniref:hypothetical protein n=1 Tax=Antarctobacter sp. TaxID=1872577 RepID=UPI002B267004|nr:hypothetical protein [Antarctobacter sp.]
MSARLGCLAVCVLLTVASAAHAGTWRTLDPASPGDCALEFEGVIEKGDLTGALERGLLDGYFSRICLNSPGGSLAEVLDFIKVSRDAYYGGTRVRSGDECLSSCAILFMFGEAFGANSPYISRQLEPGARLGFHSPFIRDGTGSAASDAEVFGVALRVAKLLSDRSYMYADALDPALPQELLALLFGTPADQMRHVKTVGEARILGIELWPDPERTAVFPDTEASLDALTRRICANSHTLTYRHSFVSQGYDFDELVQVAEAKTTLGPEDLTIHKRRTLPPHGNRPETYFAVLSGLGYWVPGWHSAGSQQYCRVEMTKTPAPGGFIVGGYDVEFGQFIDANLNSIPAKRADSEGIRGGILPLDTLYGR